MECGEGEEERKVREELWRGLMGVYVGMFLIFEEDGTSISWVGVKMMADYLVDSLKILSIGTLIDIKKILTLEARE